MILKDRNVMRQAQWLFLGGKLAGAFCPATWLHIILNVSLRCFYEWDKHLNQWILNTANYSL